MKIHYDLNENNIVPISSGFIWVRTIRPVSPVLSASLYYSPKALTVRDPSISQMVHPKYMHVLHSFEEGVKKRLNHVESHSFLTTEHYFWPKKRKQALKMERAWVLEAATVRRVIGKRKRKKKQQTNPKPVNNCQPNGMTSRRQKIWS